MNYSAISRRFWAMFFDNCIVSGVFFGLAMLLRMAGMNIFPVEEMAFGEVSALSNFYLLYAIVFLLYEVGFLSSNLSSTPGKMIMDMEVACANASFIKVLLRSIIKLVSTLTGLSIIFYTIALFNEKKQALHDLIAGSFVIDRENSTGSAMDLTQNQTKNAVFFEEMKSRGLKTFSEQKALEEEMYGKAKKSPINTILSSSFIWVMVLVLSFGVSFIGSKVLVQDMISEVKTMPLFRENGAKVDQSIADKYVGTWSDDKRTVGFTVYYNKKTGTMYINTTKGALSFMFDSEGVLYITEDEYKFKITFASESFDAIYMTGPINTQSEYKYLLKKE